MSTATRIGGFVALLLLIFGGAAIAGSKIDPGVDEPSDEMAMETHGSKTHTGDAAAAALPGLAVESGGYRLVTENTITGPNPTSELEFSIVDESGATVRDFDVEHERRMHLIVVRRDFQAFQHLHPEQRPDGSWTVNMDSSRPGDYRVFADFATHGESMTLATDRFVPGKFDPRPLAPVSDTADAGDGYEVTISSPEAHAGDTAETEFAVSDDGRPVEAIEPYLGADGHLVALREGDQAFLHTHPEGEPGGPGPIRFGVTYPSAGRYRLFLQFRHGGKVRTAEFTRVVEPSAHDEGTAETEGAGDESH